MSNNRWRLIAPGAIALAAAFPAAAGALGTEPGDAEPTNGDHKVSICHRDQGSPEWKLIEIAESALPAHLAHQWGEDIYPVPSDGCPVSETEPSTTPPTTEPPTTPAPNLPEVIVDCGTITVTGDFQQGEITFTGGVASLHGPSPLVATIGEDVNGGAVSAFVRAGDLEEQYVIITDCDPPDTVPPTEPPTVPPTEPPTTTEPSTTLPETPTTTVPVPETTLPEVVTTPAPPTTALPPFPELVCLPDGTVQLTNHSSVDVEYAYWTLGSGEQPFIKTAAGTTTSVVDHPTPLVIHVKGYSTQLFVCQPEPAPTTTPASTLAPTITGPLPATGAGGTVTWLIIATAVLACGTALVLAVRRPGGN